MTLDDIDIANPDAYLREVPQRLTRSHRFGDRGPDPDSRWCR